MIIRSSLNGWIQTMKKVFLKLKDNDKNIESSDKEQN